MTDNTALALLDSGVSSALSGFNAATEESFMPFPVTIVKDGSFKPHKSVPDEVKDRLPDGSKGIPAVFLTYRIGVLAWQVGYDDRNDDNKNPAFVAFAPANNEAMGRLIGEAGKSYHYTAKDDKKQYDFATSKVGHVQPLVEALFYLPGLDGLGVIATPSNFNSVEETISTLKALVNKESGSIPQAPMIVTPGVAHKSTKNWDWDVDYIGIAPAPLTPATAELGQKFKAWRDKAAEDLTVKANLEAWLTCSDRPMTDEIVAALHKAVGLVPRRSR